MNLKKIRVFSELILNRIAYLLPNYPTHRFIHKFFEFFRQIIWKNLFKDYGSNSFIRSNVKIIGYDNISIGNNCLIGPNSILNGARNITIGDFFLSGPELIIYTAEHGVANEGKPFILQNNSYKEVRIGRNVYAGARVIILMGVTVGDNVVIAAGSIVTKNIPSNELWGGVPAKKIKSL